MLFKPIVENCFGHAFIHNKNLNLINLDIDIDNEYMFIEAQDKGLKLSELKKLKKFFSERKTSDFLCRI
jgi:hypothetical protein